MQRYSSRKRNRLTNWNYSEPSDYFITICSFERQNIFGDIKNDEMFFSEIGKIVNQCWLDIPKHFRVNEIDSWVIMPNHIHGILTIQQDLFVVGNNHGCSLPVKRNHEMIPKVISMFKSSVTRIVRKNLDVDFPIWQKSYYDHIIRSERSLEKIRQYIENNVYTWEKDTENIDIK